MYGVSLLIALAVATALLLLGVLDLARHRSEARVWIMEALVIVASVAVSIAAA